MQFIAETIMKLWTIDWNYPQFEDIFLFDAAQINPQSEAYFRSFAIRCLVVQFNRSRHGAEDKNPFQSHNNDN